MAARKDKKWRILMARQPEKMLHRLPQNVGERIDQAILSLADDPRPPGSKKLVGYEDLYRIRVGDWRIVYTIRDEQLLILVVRIAPRGTVYRGLQ